MNTFLIILICCLIFYFYNNQEYGCKELLDNIKNKILYSINNLNENFENIKDIMNDKNNTLDEEVENENKVNKELQELAKEQLEKNRMEDEIKEAKNKIVKINMSILDDIQKKNEEQYEINEKLRLEDQKNYVTRVDDLKEVLKTFDEPDEELLDSRDLQPPNNIQEAKESIPIIDGEDIERPLFRKEDEKIVYPDKTPLVKSSVLAKLLSERKNLFIPPVIPKDAYFEYRERQLAKIKFIDEKNKNLEQIIKKINQEQTKKIVIVSESDKVLNKVKKIRVVSKVSNYDPNTTIDTTLASLLEVLPVLTNIKSDGKIHSESLSKIKVPIKLDLITNNNPIINTGERIYQDILQTESNKAYIYNQRHNLMQVSWLKSKIQWFGENIKLENRFTFINSDDGFRVHIVFPLVLVDIPKIETFADTYFDIGLNKFETTINSIPYKFGDLNEGVIQPVSLTTSYCNNKVIKEKVNEKAKLLTKNISESNYKTLLQEQLKKSILTKIDENTMIKEIQKETAKLKNEMNAGIMRPVTETKYFKNSKVYSEDNTFYDSVLVKSALSNINHEKIDIYSIPTSTKLTNLSNTLNNINFNSITNQIKNVKYSISDINTFFNLNTLITNPDIIPEFICCTPISGSLITFNFSKIQEKILAQDIFYYTSEPDGALVLYTQPQPFDKLIGSTILSNLK